MEDMGNTNMMGSSSTSFDSMIGGLLVLLVKFLFIALIATIIIAMIIWIKNNFFKNVNITQYMNQNPILKSILGITAALVGLLLLIYVFNYFTNPTYPNYNGMDQSYAYNSGGFSGSLGITGVFTFLVKVLTYVFMITLIISLVAYFKKQMESNDFHFFKPNGSTNMDNTTSRTAGKPKNNGQNNVEPMGQAMSTTEVILQTPDQEVGDE